MLRPFLFCAVLTAAVGGSFSDAFAETRCETKTQVCMDVRLGARVCTVTICKDDLGNIVSTDIIVLRDGAATAEPAKPKLPRAQVPSHDLKIAK